MALVVKDRVKETTNTTGTSTFELEGAVTGFLKFDDVMTNNGVDTTYYACTDNTNWEVGIGTFNDNSSGKDTLTRDTILASSNSGSKVSWSSGTRTIFMTYPADKAVFLNASNQLMISGTAVTSSAAELNILDGVTASASELNILDGVTSTASELNILDGVTSTTAELNILDGVTSTTAELNILDGVTSTASELNILDGVTATVTELNILDGVTSSTTELNILDGVTATTAELNILDGVTSTAAELNILDGKSFLDEDNMASNSATGIASQQSIKAYVDSQVTAQDLDFQGDTGGALSIDLDSETLDIAGGTGIDTSGSGNTLTVAIDSTVTTLSGTQTLTNKTLTSPKINEDVAVTSTATELNILDGVTSSTAELNILDGVTATASELNILDGVTSTTTELNILDGVTSTTAELNILDGVTSTAAELNILDGVTATTSELNIMDGVTSTTAELNILDGVTSTTAELNILDGVTATASELNILDGKSFVDEDNMASDSATAIASQQSIKAYVDANSGGMSGFVIEDGDGTEVTVSNNKEVKFVEGGGLDINWTDTSTGSDGDPYDLTFTVNAAQTGIESVLNTSLVVGRDADNQIKFGTDNQIIFEVDGGDNVIFKTSGEIEASSLDISGDADIDGTLEADAITVGGTALNTVIAGVTVTDATNAAHVLVTDNESAAENNLITFVENAQDGTGNHGLEMDGNFKYNPSTGTVMASVFRPENGGQANIMFTNVYGQLCFAMDGDSSKVTFLLDDEDGQPIFTFQEEDGTDIMDGGDTDVTVHKPFIANSTITVGDGNLVLGSTAVTSTAAELNILDGVTATASELNIMDGVTSTTAELNILDGVTATASELNIMDGVTATTAELNILDGVTATASELNIMDGVTSTAAELNILDGVTATASELNIMDGVTATTAELNYSDGVTSAIQTQLDAKATKGFATAMAIAL